MIPKLLTPVEVARMKGLSRTVVYRAMSEGKLPFIHILGRRAIVESDAQQWQPPGKITGRPKGIPVSEETKARISAGQKKRWQQRQQTDAGRKPKSSE